MRLFLLLGFTTILTGAALALPAGEAFA